MDNPAIYPRTVVLLDPKLRKLVEAKGEVVIEGRKLSEEIDAKEKEMRDIDLEIQEIEKKIDLSDLKAEAEELTKEFNAVMDKMEKNQLKVRERMLAWVPQEPRDKYEAKKKEKEILENQRNKAALRIQKLNDKIIPLARNLMKPHLQNEFEDYDTVRIEEEGERNMVATIFNHLEDWKKIFFKRIKK